MKKYYLINPDDAKWELIYCDKNEGHASTEDIAKSIMGGFVVGNFDKNLYYNIDKDKLLLINDRNLFILTDCYGDNSIWQIGPKEHDMNGTIIPNLYKVRKIGYIID